MQIRAHDDYVNCLKYAKDQGRAEGLAEGREEGLAEAQREIVMTMRQKGLSDEEILSLTGISADVIGEM